MAKLAQNQQIHEDLLKSARVVPHQVSLLKLSKTQLKVLQSINQGEYITAAQISERCELSQSWASSILKRLVEKLYLSRIEGHQLSGGIEFNYLKIPNRPLRSD